MSWSDEIDDKRAIIRPKYYMLKLSKKNCDKKYIYIYICKINEFHFTLIKGSGYMVKENKILFTILILLLERKFCWYGILWDSMTNVNSQLRERLIYKSESLLGGINHHLCIFVIFSIKINLRPNQLEIQLQFLVKLWKKKLSDTSTWYMG